jgi:hypothetical protein
VALLPRGNLHFVFEIWKTNQIPQTSILFNPFLWFNPEEGVDQIHLENDAEVRLLVVESADNPWRLQEEGTA